MNIHTDKCLELNLPEPKSYDTQRAYVIKLISSGFVFNTRMARYIGIHNLHSIVSTLAKKGYKFIVKHGLTECPFSNTTPPQLVDIVYMTAEQITFYKKEKAAKESKFQAT
ncbi:hypothetical protein [Pseudocolwellia agarivorans]|uniref:hypothetical protein n=1 Tax=Pseudocolwellia agarivorans TaxID=1911682 RepID=UPI0009844CBD|nr:hypothetical protein [Pseudocolwellia agarivorans]